MPLIERYILKRVLGPVLWTLIVSTFMVLITQLLNRVNLLTQTGQSLAVFAKMGISLIPELTMIMLPFAFFIGVSRTLSMLNSDSEIAVMEAAGCPPRSVNRPILLLGVFFTLSSLFNAHFIEPRAMRDVRNLVNAASADLMRNAIQTGSFTRLDNNTFVQVGESFPGGDFGSFVLIDSRDPDTQLVYYAKRGALKKIGDKTLLVLAQGELQRKDKHSGDVSIVHFTTTVLDFSEFASGSGRGWHAPEEFGTADLLAPDPSNGLTQFDPASLRRELHRRFSEWLFPLAFGLIAVYFGSGAQSHRQDRVAQLATGSVIAVALRAAGFFTVSKSGDSQIFAILAYSVPLSAIVLFSLGVATGRSLKVPRKLVDGIADMVAMVSRPFLGLARRLRSDEAAP